jgi:hypothetical protein
MIGRQVAAGLGAVLLLGAVLSQRSFDPRIADPGRVAAIQAVAIHDRQAAVAALDSLAAALRGALDEGRQGAALTVQTGERPGPHLALAGERLGSADPLAGIARQSMARLAGDLELLDIADPPVLDVASGALTSSGARLTASGTTADAFWSMHVATRATLEGLAAAFAALEARDVTGALADVDRADASLATVRAWRGALDTLPVWIDTASQLADAVRGLVEATRDHDQAAAEAAAALYRTAATEAHRADLALAIAVAEGGGSVSAAPLASAADALRAVEAAVAAVNSLVIPTSILG